MSIKPVLVPDHDAASLRKLMDSFADAASGPTRQQLSESRAAVAAAQQNLSEGYKDYKAPYNRGRDDIDNEWDGEADRREEQYEKAQQERKAKEDQGVAEGSLNEFIGGYNGGDDDDGNDRYDHSGYGMQNPVANKIARLLKQRQPVFYEFVTGGEPAQIRSISRAGGEVERDPETGSLVGPVVFDIARKTPGGRAYLDQVTITPRDGFSLVAVGNKQVARRTGNPDVGMPDSVKQMRDTFDEGVAEGFDVTSSEKKLKSLQNKLRLAKEQRERKGGRVESTQERRLQQQMDQIADHIRGKKGVAEDKYDICPGSYAEHGDLKLGHGGAKCPMCNQWVKIAKDGKIFTTLVPHKKPGVAEATGNPGMPTPHDQGRADAKKGRPYDNPYDQPGEQQEHSQYKKGYEQGKQQGVAEGKKRSDRFHIVGKDGKPATLASYADQASAVKDRDAKHPGAEVRQVGPRGKIKGVAEGSLEEYGDTAKGQKMLGKVHNRAADQVTSKKADKDPAYARKAQQTQDRAWDRLAVKEQGVAEAYQFKGDFPFDVDHMNGAVYRGGDTPAGLSKNTKMQYHDKQQWQAAVNKTNSLRYDDNSEFNSDRSGTTVEVDGKVWAVWNDVKGFGWVEAGTGVEEGLGKTIKRGLQGWGRSGMTGPNGEDFNDPRDIVRRNRGYDDKTVQGLQKSMSGPGPGFPFNHGDIDKHPHSPAGLQKRVLDREMKKRGLGEEGVPHNDPNLAKAYRMGNEAYLAFKNDPARAQAAQDKIESEFPQYAAMWLTGYRDGERFDKEKSVSESIDPIEQLRADIKRFAQ